MPPNVICMNNTVRDKNVFFLESCHAKCTYDKEVIPRLCCCRASVLTAIGAPEAGKTKTIGGSDEQR